MCVYVCLLSLVALCFAGQMVRAELCYYSCPTPSLSARPVIIEKGHPSGPLKGVQPTDWLGGPQYKCYQLNEMSPYSQWGEGGYYTDEFYQRGPEYPIYQKRDQQPSDSLMGGQLISGYSQAEGQQSAHPESEKKQTSNSPKKVTLNAGHEGSMSTGCKLNERTDYWPVEPSYFETMWQQPQYLQGEKQTSVSQTKGKEFEEPKLKEQCSSQTLREEQLTQTGNQTSQHQLGGEKQTSNSSASEKKNLDTSPGGTSLDKVKEGQQTRENQLGGQRSSSSQTGEKHGGKQPSDSPKVTGEKQPSDSPKVTGEKQPSDSPKVTGEKQPSDSPKVTGEKQPSDSPKVGEQQPSSSPTLESEEINYIYEYTMKQDGVPSMTFQHSRLIKDR